MEWNSASIEGRIGLQFKDQQLLRLALIHPSYAKQLGEPDYDNQRLEWLGETILYLIVFDYLYRNCGYLEVNKLVALQDKLISEERLTKLWFQFNLGDSYPFLNLKDDRAILRQKRSNPFEKSCKALIGAVYLDKGFSQTRTWLTKHLIAPLLERHLKPISERVSPDKQLKLLGGNVLEAILSDYLYQNLPLVQPNLLNNLYSPLISKEVLKSYLEQLTESDYSLIASENQAVGKKYFDCFVGAVYLKFSEQQIKGSLKKTKDWFTTKFIDDEQILVTAINLLLKNNQSQKWIIRNVLGYESNKYQQGKERFHDLIESQNKKI
jgi:dsRNA-specific ribonuclease